MTASMPFTLRPQWDERPGLFRCPRQRRCVRPETFHASILITDPRMSDRLGTPEPPRPVRTRLPAEARQASVMYLMSMLTHDDPRVRRRAAGALGRLQDAGALDSLIMVLHDGDPHVQQAAIGALGAIGDPRAIPALRQPHPRADRRFRAMIEDAQRAIAATQAEESVPDPDHDRLPPRWHAPSVGRSGPGRWARVRPSSLPCLPRESCRCRSAPDAAVAVPMPTGRHNRPMPPAAVLAEGPAWNDEYL